MPVRPEPRLPRSLVDQPLAEGLVAQLARRARPLWSGATHTLVDVAFRGELRVVLEAANDAGRIVRGLESAARALQAEARGQALADRRSRTPRGARVSRLLFLSNDGAERFYRAVDSLLREHEGRVLAFGLDADAASLGAALFGDGAMARLLLVDHKEPVADALLAIAHQWQKERRS